MEKEFLSIYDIQNKKGIVIKSQVILEMETFGFEIIPDYIVNNKKSTLSEENKGTIYLENASNNEIYLSFSYLKVTKKKFNEELQTYINKFHYDHFTNYRDQEIHEFIDDFNMIIIFYYEGYMFIVTKRGEKYSQEYYELYFTVYSLYKIKTKKLEYNNPELEAQSACLRNNGQKVYRYFNHLNLVKVNPIEMVMNLKNEQLKELLDKGINPKIELILPNKTYFSHKKEIEEEEEVKTDSFDKDLILERIEKISKELDELKKLIMKQ
ncbi:MAG: hypothetical protein PHO63_00885 [Bacilli bacterium]|nr:hypothetical protein [Bacilli bacterium]MDD4809342.1 hypothetical protein [Bacilli bacterium]